MRTHKQQHEYTCIAACGHIYIGDDSEEALHRAVARCAGAASAEGLACVSICTLVPAAASVFVQILLDQQLRQHTAAYVSIRQHTCSATSALHTSAYVSIYWPTCSATSAYVSSRQHTAAYGSIRQHTSAYVSIRQHTCSATSALPADARMGSVCATNDTLKSFCWQACNSAFCVSICTFVLVKQVN